MRLSSVLHQTSVTPAQCQHGSLLGLAARSARSSSSRSTHSQHGSTLRSSRPLHTALTSRRVGTSAASTSEGLQGNADQSDADLVSASGDWDAWTSRLVAGATAAFLLLLVPQIIMNATNMINGDQAALAAIAWVGYLTSLLGNVMLLSYFLDRKEGSGALVQSVGIVTNAMVLTQMMAAGCMPQSIYVSTLALLAVAMVVSLLQKQGFLESTRGQAILRSYSDFLGLAGVTALAQAATSTFAGVSSPLPGIAGFALAATLLVLDRRGKLTGSCKSLWRGVPAWSATLLFGFQPVAQLAKNFSGTANLAGLSKGTLALAMVGNGCMVPRALFTRDVVWLTGSAWACFTGWCQLFSLFISRSPLGVRYLGWLPFAGATLAYVSYNLAILRKDMRSKGLPVTPASVPKLLNAVPQ